MFKKVLLFIVCINLCLLVHLNAQVKEADRDSKLTCSDCHTCENPTAENPCLRSCPRHWMKKIEGRKLKLTESPQIVTLNTLEKLYEPVKFTHRVHADMAEMGEGCMTCHHYTPTNQSHPQCGECHEQNLIKENIRQPGLKGAYHRQCMGCHREWAKDTKCEVCHALKGKEKKETTETQVSYRPAKEPDKVVFKNKFHKGPYVTFFHKNHKELFGLVCKDCHKNQPCSACHYQKEKPSTMGGLFAKNRHGACSSCHKVIGKGTCSKCHAMEEKKDGFDHGTSTGWALNIYHKKLSCNKCHKGGKYKGMNNSCDGCHSGWNSENFNHATVGLALNEIHIELDCSDCHTDRKFGQKPNCSDCHEDETYPEYKPGTVTKKGN